MELNESEKLKERVDLLRSHEQEQTDLKGKLQNANEQKEVPNETSAQQIQADLSQSEERGRISGLINGESLEASPACQTELEDKKATSDQVRSLESRLVEKDAQIAALNNRVTKLEAELARETPKADRQLKCLNVKNVKLQSHAEEEIAGMRLLLSRAECQIQKGVGREYKLEQQLHEQRVSTEAESAAAFDRIGMLENLQKSQELIASLLNTISEAEKENHRLNLEIGKQANQYNHRLQLEVGMSTELKQITVKLQQKLAESEKMQKNQDREVSLLNKQISKADQENHRLNLQIGGLNSNIEQNSQILAEQANQLATCQNVNAELNHRLQLEVARNIEIRKRFQQIARKLQHKLAESENMQKIHDRKVVLLNKQISEAEEKNHRFNLEIGGLKANIEENRRMLADQGNQLDTLQNINAVLNHRLQLEVAVCTEVKEHLQQVTAELQQVRAEAAVQMLRSEFIEATLAGIQAKKGKLAEAQTQTDVVPAVATG